MFRNLRKHNNTGSSSSPTQSVITNALDTNLYSLNTTEEGECPLDFPYKLGNATYCSKKCNATDFFNGNCAINNKDSTVKDDMINNIRNGLFNHTMDKLLIDIINGKKEDLIKVQDNTKFTLTTSDNQKNN